jgi:hypothetical protein
MNDANDSKPQANMADVESVDAIISAAYRLISGKAGEKRDWARVRSLYAPGARLIPTSKEAGVRIPDGGTPEPLDVEAYIARVNAYFDQTGFFETEIARRTEQFDRIVHAFSSYESRYSPEDPEPFMRGINSIQLFNDGRRWWIVTIYWQQEHPDKPIPERYLQKNQGKTPNIEH